jgi:hypothetical protein
VNAEQKHLLAVGRAHGEALADYVTQAINTTKKKVVAKRHWYIQSPPGLGKTYTVQDVAKRTKTELVMIQGATSLAAFVRMVAFAVYVKKPTAKDPLFFCVDDCDDLFIYKNNLNVMKGVLDQITNVLHYEKDMTGVIAKYRDAESATTKKVADALLHFQTDGGVGVTIPTDHCIFIILSNKALASEREAQAKPKLIHEAAVRSRLNYTPINVKDKEFWGWNAHVVLTSSILGKEFPLTKKQKEILLEWTYDNWERLPATDLREIGSLAAEMLNFPDDYVRRWKLRLNR